MSDASLKALCPPGTTVYTILRSTGRGGYTRIITPLVWEKGPVWLPLEVAQVVGLDLDIGQHGVIVKGGTGVDLVRLLGIALHSHPDALKHQHL